MAKNPGKNWYSPCSTQTFQPFSANEMALSYCFVKQRSIAQLWAKEHISSLLTWPAFLDMIGCDYHNGYTLQFLNENREVVSVEVPVLSESAYRTELARSGGKLKLVRPENWDSLFYLNEGNWAEYVEGDDSDCVYMSIGTELQGNNQVCWININS